MLGAEHRRDLGESGLRRAVPTPRLVRLDARVGDEIDDPRVRREPRQGELDERERREHVRLVHVPQLLEWVPRQERERARAEQAGVVDEEVDWLAGCLHEPEPVVGIGDVARNGDHAGEAGDRMLERLRSPRVDGELPAALGKSAREREPEAASMLRSTYLPALEPDYKFK